MGLRPDIVAALRSLPVTTKEMPHVEALGHHLLDDEVVIVIAAALHEHSKGIVTLTDRRLLFTSEGTRRSVSRELPLSRIHSVDWSAGWILGDATISVDGRRVQFTSFDKKRGWPLVRMLRERIRYHI